jgi:hypothetical protein
VLSQVFIYNAVTGCKKRQHVFNKVPLPIVQVFPICKVLAEVNFFGCPETGFSLLIKFPNVVVLNGEEDETVFVLPQNWFFLYRMTHLLMDLWLFNWVTSNASAKHTAGAIRLRLPVKKIKFLSYEPESGPTAFRPA